MGMRRERRKKEGGGRERERVLGRLFSGVETAQNELSGKNLGNLEKFGNMRSTSALLNHRRVSRGSHAC